MTDDNFRWIISPLSPHIVTHDANNWQVSNSYNVTSRQVGPEAVIASCWSFPSTLRWQILQFLFKQWPVGSYLDTFLECICVLFYNSHPTSPPHLISLCVLLESSAFCKPLCLPRPRPPTPDFPWWCNCCSSMFSSSSLYNPPPGDYLWQIPKQSNQFYFIQVDEIA